MSESKTTALNRVFRKATMEGECFRQWLYPNAPDSYETNPEALKIADSGDEAGKTADEIEADIVTAWRTSEIARLLG